MKKILINKITKKIVALVVAIALMVGMMPPMSATTAIADNVNVAFEVYLVGQGDKFGDWNLDNAIKMTQDGCWFQTTIKDVPAGAYEYKFVQAKNEYGWKYSWGGTVDALTAGGDYLLITVTEPSDITFTFRETAIKDNNEYDLLQITAATLCILVEPSKVDLSKCTTTLSETSYTYDGKKKEPTVAVKDGTKTLTKGTDYTVKYDNNTAIGKATVTITGMGNYTGTITKNFTISKGDYYNSTTNGGTWKNGTYTLGGVKMTNIFFSDGKYTYYLQADGTAMKNRLTYHPDGVHLIYFDDKGHELFDQFQYCKDVGYTCYFDTNGYLYKDVITFVDGKPYYLDGTGKMKQNEYFKFDNQLDLGYAQADGSLINTGFGYDPYGQVVFYHWNGMIARGLITDGAWYYDMDLTDGHLIGQFAAN